ncbi:MAG: MBL fold metallo-hydrolase RNA specificity domain-containing protein [Bacteroidota bacterium]|jgi:metallo-beta-lactamase family protein
MNIRFMGAARTVTGSRHLLTVNNHQILLDCGLFQGKNEGGVNRNISFGFDPHQVHCVILSHAHIDHSGMLPRLVREGFSGKVYCTPATADLCQIMLLDSARIQENDVRYVNKRRQKRGQKSIEPLYSENDVRELLRLLVKVPYDTDWIVSKGVSFRFTDAGHILGSAAVSLTLTENERTVKLAFTGDVGRFHDLILREPQPFPQADIILCESTYGNRLHDTTEDSAAQLLEVVRHTCVEKKGRLLIPSFSLGRTQEIVYTLDRMKSAGLLPPIPVFVDSPLSTNATEIMRKHPENFNEDILKYMETDPDPFGFNGLEYIQEKEASQALNYEERPCIIISASGMLEAGRIKHHVKHGISDERNTILIVGYCSPGTLGSALVGGAKEVRIFGEPHEVKAEVVRIGSYSAHADRNELLDFLKCQDPGKVKHVYLVHGETEAQNEFSKYLIETGFRSVSAPEFGDKVEL